MAPATIPFQELISTTRLGTRRAELKTVQVSLGKRCSQSCLHCHVDAGPNRTEAMDEMTCRRVIELLKASSGLKTVDLTGGAPEMNPHFKGLALAGRGLGLEVIDRCNLTILIEPDYAWVPQFLADQQIHVIASLPCYTKNNVDKQRGTGVFEKSLEGLRQLNLLGYGRPGSGLILDLVYNPFGAFLPAPQQELERNYRWELARHFDIAFNQLLTITNMPINRFLHQLKSKGELEAYMSLLWKKFNPCAAEKIMCRGLISVSWNGSLFDCDFNQMLDIPIGCHARSIWDIQSFNEAALGPIAFEDHCYGCTAGAGSSCVGVTDPAYAN